MSLFSSKRLRFNPLLEFHGSVSADNLEAASSSSNEVAPHKASHCSSRLLEWDNGWDIGDEANEEIIHPQYKDPSAQFETSLDSIWTWPTCHRDCVPVIIDRPTRERQPTPPPVHSYRRKTPSPQFLHPAELAHNHGKLEIVQCNNHSLSSSRVDLSTWELCEAVTRAEMWTQRSMKGLREHAQSLLAATEAEERRLRERLASLQSQMMISVETERSEEPSESTTIGENPAAERRKGDPRPQEQIDEVTANVNSNTSAVAPQFDRHRHESVYAKNENFLSKGDLKLTSHVSSNLENADDIILKEQKQEERQSQWDDVNLIAEETGDHREHGGSASVESQVQNSILNNQSKVCEATYHLEGAREQSTTSDVDNFCQDESKWDAFRLFTRSEEADCRNRLPPEEVNEQGIRPGDAFSQVIKGQDLSLELIPTVDEVSLNIQNCPSSNGPVIGNSLTEVSSCVEAIVNESGRFPVEISGAMQQRFIELFKEELKKLKVAKAAYLSKRQTIRELKMFLDRGLGLSESQTLLSAEENSSLANSYTNVTPPKPETIADAPCRSTVNSPLPSSISSLHPRIASRSRISPCCKIVSAARKPNTDVLQMKPAKSTQNSKALDVDKMYIEFVRTFEQAQPRHKAFSAYQCSSPCGTPSPPTPTDFEGHSCPLARIRGSAPLCSCHAFHLSCACSYNTDDTHNINKKHPFSPYDCYHYNYHHHRGQCHGPSRPSCPPHTAPCQESINPHYNNSYFNGLSAATNQTDFRQPYNTKEPPPALPHAKAMHSAREYAKGRQQFTPSHCARADVGEAIPSSTSKKLFDHTHSFNNGFIKVNGGGCSWFQFSPQRRLKSASATKSTKPQLLEQREVSKSTHWRPAFRDYSHDTMVRFNVSCTNPPYACDREEDFNQHNGSTRNPQSLQEAFQLRMKAFMARSEARQRFIRLNALERRLQAEYSVLRSLNNSNTVYPDTEMALRARTPRLSLPDCLHCPQFSSTIGRTAYGGAGMKKLEKSKRKLMTPYEAHQLAQVRKKISLFINRARMKQYSEAIRRRLLKRCTLTITEVW
ncbi:hypothetical protein TcWFU_002018 [Taenia crassiceps]|uniref:ALMS motif domain-containing protein n=1 Tax=Taenia crassiceps TaxID=6207 RepID=A0ABR4QNW5_9CEST